MRSSCVHPTTITLKFCAWPSRRGNTFSARSHSAPQSTIVWRSRGCWWREIPGRSSSALHLQGSSWWEWSTDGCHRSPGSSKRWTVADMEISSPCRSVSTASRSSSRCRTGTASTNTREVPLLRKGATSLISCAASSVASPWPSSRLEARRRITRMKCTARRRRTSSIMPSSWWSSPMVRGPSWICACSLRMNRTSKSLRFANVARWRLGHQSPWFESSKGVTSRAPPVSHSRQKSGLWPKSTKFRCPKSWPQPDTMKAPPTTNCALLWTLLGTGV
mmetsp:Transcript_22828/g.60136  ORF Transcript_22828/g.60136 Transcript_22828/m.60136 type:complete len:276 (+) Transcript_22828:528-1355(+)